MSTITTKDGTTIYYKDWGSGPVVTLSHGWPLNSDMWDGQMLFLAQHGFRVVAHDRRGHGRSSQAWSGNDMDGYADDLAAVIEALDLKDITMVGHSTGGGEVARYIGRYGTKRVAKAVLIAAVPPIMLKSATNPEGLPIEVFDNLRSALAKDRSQAYKDFAPLFYGANRPGAQVSQGTLDQFWLWSMQAGLKNAYDSIKAFSETDFTEDLKKFDIPTLVMHGEDDQIVPVKDSAKKSAQLIKGAVEIYYPGLPHGLTATHADIVNRDLLAFIQQGKRQGRVTSLEARQSDVVPSPSLKDTSLTRPGDEDDTFEYVQRPVGGCCGGRTACRHDGNRRNEARKAEPWSDQHRARPRRVGRRVKLVEGDSTSPGERVLTSLQFRHHLHRWPTTSTP